MGKFFNPLFSLWTCKCSIATPLWPWANYLTSKPWFFLTGSMGIIMITKELLFSYLLAQSKQSEFRIIIVTVTPEDEDYIFLNHWFTHITVVPGTVCVQSIISVAAAKSLAARRLHHERQPTRLTCAWDFPGKSTAGCHCLLPTISDKRLKTLVSFLSTFVA